MSRLAFSPWASRVAFRRLFSTLAKPGSEFSYSRLGDPSREIRLLELQAGRGSDPVACNIVTANLGTQDIAYEALSYTWGIDDASRSMLLAGRTFAIRPNLDAALRQLRKTDETRRLWVDAVCINQDDIEERNAQVRGMLRIYETASRVLVWLGPASQHSHLAMARDGLMHNFHAITHEMWDASLSPDSPRYQGFGNLIGRPWWQRTWVIQEVVVAKNVTVVCGPDEIKWERLAGNLAQLVQTMSLLGPKAPMSLPDKTVAIEAFRLQRQSDDYPPMGLLETLEKFRTWLATDPRDKVYGLLGLAAGGADRVPIDYSLPVNEVYENVARHSLQDSFKVMALADPKSRRQGLASWAPDWTTELPFYPFRPSTLFDSSSQSAYSPSSSAERSFKITDDGKCLAVQVDVAGEICVGGDFEWAPFDRKKEALRHGEAFFMDIMGDMNWAFEQSAREAYRRTLIADMLDDSRISPQDLERYLAWFESADEEPKLATQPVEGKISVREVSEAEYSRLLPEAMSEFAHARDIHRDKTREKDDEDFFRAIGTASKGRVLFLTRDGLLGLGPKGLKNGDLVCVPVGGDMPWLVRPVEAGFYEFVGECYAHWIMDGDVQMPAEDSLRDISLR